MAIVSLAVLCHWTLGMIKGDGATTHVDDHGIPKSSPKLQRLIEIRDTELRVERLALSTAAQTYIAKWDALYALKQGYMTQLGVERDMRRYRSQMAGRIGAIGGDPKSILGDPVEFPIIELNEKKAEVNEAFRQFEIAKREYKVKSTTINLKFEKDVIDFPGEITAPQLLAPEIEHYITVAEEQCEHHDYNVVQFVRFFGSPASPPKFGELPRVLE